MTIDSGSRVMLGLITVVVVAAALQVAKPVIAPVAFALFVNALAWPAQRAIERALPRPAALLIVVLGTVVVTATLVLTIVWGGGRIVQWLVANAGRLQALYLVKAEWLEGHGVAVAGLLAEHFDIRWLVGLAQGASGQLQGFITFALLTLVLTILGLLEVEITRDRLLALAGSRPGAAARVRASGTLAAKLRRYMLVRTAMSVLTGIAVWAFAHIVGLELATEWGVMACALNYIPVIGPLLATALPTLFAVLQFASVEAAVTVFVVLNVIQFAIGSTLEPRVAGAALAMSPFLVLLTVFVWTFLWGIAGAFIGIPIMMAALTLCDASPGSRWVAELLSGRKA